jgi:putative addiction module component (TIGR02574 family)
MLAIKTNQLLSEVELLPLDLKTKLIEKLLESLNPTKSNIEKIWQAEIDTRVDAIEAGTAKLINSDDVFRKIKDRFN